MVAVRGAEQVAKNLDRLARRGAQIQSAASSAMARVVRDNARRSRAFEDRTGRLRQSIRVIIRPRVRGFSLPYDSVFGYGGAIVVAGGPGARYAPFVEFGTVSTVARRRRGQARGIATRVAGRASITGRVTARGAAALARALATERDVANLPRGSLFGRRAERQPLSAARPFLRPAILERQGLQRQRAARAVQTQIARVLRGN